MAQDKLYEFVTKALLKPINESEASEQAKMLGLKNVRWGRYADKTGNVVAKSVNGKLVRVEPDEDDMDSNLKPRSGKHPAEEPGDDEDPTMQHVNPQDKGHDMTPYSGGGKYTYSQGKGFRDKDGKHWRFNPQDPESKQLGSFIGNVNKSGTKYHAGKGFYNATTPDKDYTKFEARKPAIYEYLHENDGPIKVLQSINAAATAALKSKDKTEQWKALRLAQQFKEDLFNLAVDKYQENGWQDELNDFLSDEEENPSTPEQLAILVDQLNDSQWGPQEQDPADRYDAYDRYIDNQADMRYQSDKDNEKL